MQALFKSEIRPRLLRWKKGSAERYIGNTPTTTGSQNGREGDGREVAGKFAGPNQQQRREWKQFIILSLRLI
jgi:hypothetical protein